MDLLTRNTTGRGKGCDRRDISGRAFGRLNLRKIALEVLASNERAVSLYRSLGFVEEGRFVDQMFIDGKFESHTDDRSDLRPGS